MVSAIGHRGHTCYAYQRELYYAASAQLLVVLCQVAGVGSQSESVPWVASYRRRRRRRQMAGLLMFSADLPALHGYGTARGFCQRALADQGLHTIP